NNCRLRHRIRRAFRKTCCFSKKFENHMKAFSLAFFYINYNHFKQQYIPNDYLNLEKCGIDSL
ncbi:MAG: IS1 family transposase, partial [Chitinispirillales bacterium]|nr:IS1 family transposase [Chitinispirillales bacterium]